MELFEAESEFPEMPRRLETFSTTPAFYERSIFGLFHWDILSFKPGR